jgi:hypothetical protein
MAAISGFQKSDLVRFAVSIASFLMMGFCVIDNVSTPELSGIEKRKLQG